MQQEKDTYDTNMGWWTDRPEREDRGTTSFASLQESRTSQKEERVWTKAAVILTIMLVFGFSLLRLVSQVV